MISWSMLPPPLKRMSTMIPFLFENWLISFSNRRSDGGVHRADVDVGDLAVRLACPPSRAWLRTHSSYLMSLRVVTVPMRSLRTGAPVGAAAAVTVTYSFSGLLSSDQ